MNDEDALIDQALRAALASRSPVEMTLDNESWLVVQPEADFVMVTVGSSSGRASPVQVLQRRHEQPERLSCWLPAMLNDGTLVAVKRLPRLAGGGVDSLAPATFEQARELLA